MFRRVELLHFLRIHVSFSLHLSHTVNKDGAPCFSIALSIREQDRPEPFAHRHVGIECLLLLDKGALMPDIVQHAVDKADHRPVKLTFLKRDGIVSILRYVSCASHQGVIVGIAH